MNIVIFFSVLSTNLRKNLDIPLPEVKHKYEPDQDDRITDEELNAEYEKMDEDLVEIEKQL